MHDPRSLRLESHFEAHTGGITDIDVHGDLVVSCGWSNRYPPLKAPSLLLSLTPSPWFRMGTVFSDPMVKAYDLRTMRALPPIPFPLGPYLCRFHPLFSTLLVASQACQCTCFIFFISSDINLTSSGRLVSFSLWTLAMQLEQVRSIKSLAAVMQSCHSTLQTLARSLHSQIRVAMCTNGLIVTRSE